MTHRHSTIAITLIIICSVLPAGADTWGELEVGLEPAFELVDTGSVSIALHIPPNDELESVLFAVDNEIIAENDVVGAEYLLDATTLDDGEHRLSLVAVAADGRQGGAEAFIFVANPTVDITAYQVPEVVFPGMEMVLSIDTEGEVAGIGADLSSLNSGFSVWDLEIANSDAGRFDISYRLPENADGGEGLHEVGLTVRGADGSEYRLTGIPVFLAGGEILPVRSRLAILERHSFPLEADPEATSSVVDVQPEIELSPGQERHLEVIVEGDALDTAEILVSMDGFGGHLVFPVAGLELASGNGEGGGEGHERRSYALPLTLLPDSWYAEQLAESIFFVTLRDALGRTSSPGASGSTTTPPPTGPQGVCEVKGTARYQYTSRAGRTTTGTLDGLRVEVLTAQGIGVATAKVQAGGRYSLTFAAPSSSADLPYRLEVVAAGSKVYVSGHGGYTPHSYAAWSWRPTAGATEHKDLTIPLVHSGPFHIHKTTRRGVDLMFKRGIDLGITYVHWEKTANGSCGSCFSGGSYDIAISGPAVSPDEFDDSVILHELGHKIVATMSRDDSPGGNHSINARDVATLAWSEGLATYFGQSILGDPLFVDRDPKGGWQKRIDDLNGIPLGTRNNQESGDICEWAVGAFLWDLDDPRNLAEYDRMVNSWPRTYYILRTLRGTSDLNRGFSGKADLADFVRHFGRIFSGSRGNMHTLLSNRYSINWLSDPSFTR